MRVEVIETSELGDRSYLVHDGRRALVVDPQRDIDRVRALLGRLGVRCEMVLETHIHNDYVSGGAELARVCEARYVVSAHETVDFARFPVADGDRLTVGALTVRVLATPGHTDHHLSYVVSDGDGPPAAFTGGSLLYGSVGRTDLVDEARTEELARSQYRSVRSLAALLPADTRVYPTHGFGSFCAARSTATPDESTVAEQRATNTALTEPDEDRFVADLVGGLTAYPAYYAHMGARNRAGAGPIDLSAPTLVDPERLRERIAAGEWVVDLRDRAAYAADHIRGTVGIALGAQFATWLGWLIPWGTPVTLIGEDREQVAAAQRQLVRIGIDRPAGQALGTPADLAAPEERGAYPVVGFAALFERDPATTTVLDVRRPDEWKSGHIPGATHVPLWELLTRLDELPAGTLWVHCAAGYRASIAAGLLARAGRDVVCVDDEFAHAVALGLTDQAATTP
ncbi:MBL fold metallo-hydrolase [Amycolatopsis pigmentata]|uniref:Rhodanese-like domain-containing protein n=1 Tax=Amycolatopsis pigmentata TaxID=450801 RepID=A0ABW5FNP8_9PSEU